jgi:hypothetical protein
MNTQPINANGITKDQIVNAFRSLNIMEVTKLVTEDDMMLVASSQEYSFLLGAMWMNEQLNTKRNG